MSELVPTLVALDKGLDLQTAKITAQPGTLLDTLNYEQVDFQGQKRIDGYARYDGTLLPAFDEYYILLFTAASGWTGFPTDRSTNLFLNGKLWAVAVESVEGSATSAYTLVIDASIKPAIGDAITTVDGTPVGQFDSLVAGTDSGATQQEHYARLLELMSAVRPRITYVPEAVAGLHWFKDRLYAVAGVVSFALNSTPSQQWMNRQVIVNGTGTALVLNASEGRVDLLTAEDLDDGAVLTDPLTSQTLTLGSRVAADYATFYESRTEAQTYAEDTGTYQFGWRAKHNGWSVNFDRGIALYGQLAAVNQNRQNVGIEGPTSIAGRDGSPAVVTQKVSLTNGPQQVNGWKSYDSPTTYVLDPTDIQQTDTAFIYADAFVSWSADSSVVSTHGSDMNGLVEYSPTNSIRYTT